MSFWGSFLVILQHLFIHHYTLSNEQVKFHNFLQYRYINKQGDELKKISSSDTALIYKQTAIKGMLSNW